MDPFAVDHLGRRPQVFDAGIGAGANEDAIQLHVLHAGPRLQRHILQRTLCGATISLQRKLRGVRHRAGNRHHLAGVRSPGDVGHKVVGIQRHDAVVDGVGICRERLPIPNGGVPVGPLGRARPAA